jgi:hypothetical protein
MEGSVTVGALLALVHLARIEGLGIDVDADGALIEFGKIEYLVDGLERINVGGMSGVHFVDVGGKDAAGAMAGIALVNAEILDFEAADRRGHPAILAAMIVDAAGLANFPADGQTLEDMVAENEIAGVIALGEKEILVKGFRENSMVKNIILDVLEGELALRDGGKALDPIGDDELFAGNLFVHGVPHIRVRPRGGRRGNREIVSLPW